MKNTICFTAAAAAVAAALTMAPTAFAALGHPGMYNRVIDITPATRAVNVAQGEMVEFVDTATGQNFVWNFDADSLPFDLATIAPAGVLNGEHVTVYVQPNNARH